MKITLPIGFEPLDADWEAYDQYALKMLHQYPEESDPVLSWHDEQRAFTLSGVEHVKDPAWFKAREEYTDTAGLLLGWIRVLGREPNAVIRPFADTAKKPGTNEIGRYFLRVNVDGTDADIGLYRICSALIFNAAKIRSTELELLKAIADRVARA